MDYFLAVHRGEGDNDRLSGIGRTRTEGLAKAIALRFGGNCKPLVISASGTISRETAAIIADCFGVKPEILTLLGIDALPNDHRVWEAIKQIEDRGKDHQVVVAITQYRTTAGLVFALCRRLFGKKDAHVSPVGPSKANVLDCKTGTIDVQYY